MTATYLGRLVPTPALLAIRRRAPLRWWAGYAALAVVAVPLARLAMRSAPQPTAIAWAVLLLGGVCIVARPLLGVYLIVFLTLLGDTLLAWWYPFTLNLSSYGSVLYLHDALIVSPLELYLALTTLVWLVGRMDVRRRPFQPGLLGKPVLAFGAFAAIGFVLGVATGGDTNVALWEVRPIAYVPLLYVLVTNLCTTRRHYALLLASAVAAVALESLHALYVIFTASGADAIRLQVLGYLEHSASLHFNVVAVWLAAMAVVGQRAGRWKLALALVLLPVGITYLQAERRSAMVALMGAMLLLGYVLFHTNRRWFWTLVPAAATLTVLYLGAFWGVTGPLGMPAQAVKSVIAPGQLSAVDMSSNFYRYIETYNLVETIRAAPILGQGFGQKFLQVYPLPYIAFVWAEYIPHNSVLWIWMNMGLGGFAAMLYLVGAAVGTGARATMHVRSREAAALALTATLYVVMYMIYAYVDIAWDTGSMILLGVMLALVGNIGRLDDRAPASPEPPGRVRAPAKETTDDAPFATVTVDFAPEKLERWAS